MNFDLAPQGRSFKGAMAYYLHDKRQEGQTMHPVTAERVAWAETRNLATDTPQTAMRIMIATTKEAEAKKVGSPGRKDGKPVMAFSLAWHPSEAGTLDRAEMVRAADEALRVAKLDHLQAVIIAHGDTAHPHVHVIVNRVDTATGKLTATPPRMARDLDRWAYDYEKARGLIVSPARAEKHERAQQAREEHPEAEARKAFVEGQRDAAAARPRPPSEGQILKDLHDAQKRAHKAQWASLSAGNREAREAVYARFSAALRHAGEAHKADARPAWRQLFAEQRKVDLARAKLEQNAFGVVALSLQAAKMQLQRGEAPGRGLLSLTFTNALHSQMRARTFAEAKERDRLAFANHQNAGFDRRMQPLRAERAEALDGQRRAFEAARMKLIQTQAAEREKMHEAWKQLYTRRGANPEARPASHSVPSAMEMKAVKKDFEKASQLAPAKQLTHPTEKRFVSMPSPSPAPAGMAPAPSARRVQDVPKTPEPAPAKAQTPTPRKDWAAAAKAPEPSPAPRKDWDAKPEPTREIKPLPTRDRSKDLDRER